VQFDTTANPNEFIIKKVMADVVYGSINSCDARVITQKTSVMFIENQFSKLNSGTPGYIKGKPILLGNKPVTKILTLENGNQKKYDEIKYNLNGFALRGADQNGKCYFVNKALFKDDPTITLDMIINAVTKPLIQTMDELTYFDDPVLTFEDSMVYGCSVDFNLAELLQFGRNKEWIHLALFQNLFQLDKFGFFGNSAPEFAKDWGTVSTTSSDDPFQTDVTANEDSINLPSVRIIEVYVSKISTGEAP
jgi:Protein of unknown function (DUF1619)